jgi:hypothetical protein
VIFLSRRKGSHQNQQRETHVAILFEEARRAPAASHTIAAVEKVAVPPTNRRSCTSLNVA